MVIYEGKNFGAGRGYGDNRPRNPPGNGDDIPDQQQGAVGGLRARGRGRDPNLRNNNAPSAPADNGKPVVEQRGSPKDRSSPIGGSPDRITRELEAFKKQVELTKRPGYGSIGRHYNMLANHFEIRLSNAMTVSQYYVDITHPRLKLNRDENRKLFWTCISRNRETFTNPYSLAYDGVRSLFSLNQLQLPNGNSTYRFELNVMIPRDDKELPCSVLFQYVGPVLINMKQHGSDRCMTPIQVIDIILRQARQCPFVDYSSDFYSFGSSIYLIPNPNGVDLGGGREIWHGLYTSAHVAQGNTVLVNADVVHTAFYKQFIRPEQEYDVVQFLIEVLNSASRDRNGPYTRNQLTERVELSALEKQLFEKEIRGLNIRITHRPNMLRVYKVLKVPGRSDDTRFVLKDNIEMSVAEYFASHYKPLRFPRLPCLHVGSKCRQVFIPVEHCVLAKTQKVMRKLSENQTTTMIRTAATDAPTRMKKVTELMGMARFNQDPFVAAFGMKIDSRMIRAEGRVLPEPRIEYGSQQRGPNAKPSIVMPKDGVWRCEGERFYLGGMANGLGVVSFLNRDKDRMAERYVCQQLRVLYEMGASVPEYPDKVEWSDMRVENIERAMRRVIQGVTANGKACDMIFILLPLKNSQFYAEVKRISEIVLGVMTQCVLEKTMNKNAFVNIALKINMKLGGINSKIVADEIAKKYLVDVPTLLMGVDVTHPSPTDSRSPSIAAIVTNTDLSPMRYAASVKIQKHRRESIVYLVDVVRDRLVSFFSESKMKPERILVFRDGVAEGQFQEVLREELRGIREACLTLSQEYRPKVTFVVVQKRHHTRLFPCDMRDGVGKSRNVPPGTVIDHTLTSPESFDFYLCSHFGIQGTSRPTRYHVIYDENNFTADELQMITFYLCHMYSRCPRSVSIPAPIYYADLVCTRARNHLMSMTGEMGSDVASSISGGDSKSHVAEDDLIRGASVAEGLRNRMYFM